MRTSTVGHSGGSSCAHVSQHRMALASTMPSCGFFPFTSRHANLRYDGIDAHFFFVGDRSRSFTIVCVCSMNQRCVDGAHVADVCCVDAFTLASGFMMVI